MRGVGGGLLRVLVDGAVFDDGLEGLGEAVHDGLDVPGGVVDFVRWSLVVLAVPLIRCAVDVHVEVLSGCLEICERSTDSAMQ